MSSFNPNANFNGNANADPTGSAPLMYSPVVDPSMEFHEGTQLINSEQEALDIPAVRAATQKLLKLAGSLFCIGLVVSIVGIFIPPIVLVIYITDAIIIGFGSIAIGLGVGGLPFLSLLIKARPNLTNNFTRKVVPLIILVIAGLGVVVGAILMIVGIILALVHDYRLSDTVVGALGMVFFDLGIMSASAGFSMTGFSALGLIAID